MIMSLLSRLNLELYKLDFGYIENECISAKELEHILMVLRSGEEGSFPELEKRAENKLRQLNPKSVLLSDNKEIKLQYQKFDQELEEWSKTLSNQTVDFVSEFAPIRAQNSELVFGQKRERTICNKVEIKERYDKWDKYDADVELLKIDLKRERNLNKS